MNLLKVKVITVWCESNQCVGQYDLKSSWYIARDPVVPDPRHGYPQSDNILSNYSHKDSTFNGKALYRHACHSKGLFNQHSDVQAGECWDTVSSNTKSALHVYTKSQNVLV